MLFLKLDCFLSLSETAFTVFTSLVPNSIYVWSQLEEKFHDYFYSGETELRLSHLTSIKQKYNELVPKDITRFRDTKNQCFNLVLSEKDPAELAYSGLLSHLKEKLEGCDFPYVSEVLQKAVAQESQAKESRNLQRSSNGNKTDRPSVNMLGYDCQLWDDEDTNICVAEWSWPSKIKKACICVAMLKNLDILLLAARKTN